MAASRPMISEVPCSTGGNSASPLYSTCTPAGWTTSRTASSTATTCSRSLSSIVSLNCASEYAIRPSEENVFGLKGSPTLSRPALPSCGLNSADLIFAIASSTAALRCGVSSRWPSGAAKTTFSTPPCSDANFVSSRSVAFCVSDPGISNSSRSEPPTVPTRAIRTIKMLTHAPTTRHGCMAQARTQRAHAPVERRWCAERRSEAEWSVIPSPSGRAAGRSQEPPRPAVGGPAGVPGVSPGSRPHRGGTATRPVGR
jgi:hypothetical protein